MVNIKDVAKVADVSTATVSRVINKKAIVSKKTADKINKVVKQLDYVISHSAQEMSKKYSRFVPLFLSDETKNENYSEFIEILVNAASKHQKKIVLFNTTTDFLNQHALKTILTLKPKIVIVFRGNKKIIKLKPKFSKHKINLIELDKSFLVKHDKLLKALDILKG